MKRINIIFIIGLICIAACFAITVNIMNKSHRCIVLNISKYPITAQLYPNKTIISQGDCTITLHGSACYMIGRKIKWENVELK